MVMQECMLFKKWVVSYQLNTFSDFISNLLQLYYKNIFLANNVNSEVHEEAFD